MSPKIETKVMKLMIDGKLEKFVFVKSINGKVWGIKADTKKDGLSYVPISIVTRYLRRKHYKQKVELKHL